MKPRREGSLTGECAEVADFLSTAPLRNLSEPHRSRVELHLASCPACREMERELTELELLPLDSAARPFTVETPLAAVRAMPGPWTFILLAVATLAVVSGVLIVALGTRGFRLMNFNQIAAFTLIGAVAVGVAARLFYQEWKPGSQVLVSRELAIVAAAGGIGAFLLVGFPFQPDWAAFLISGAVCVSIGTASSFVAGWLLGVLSHTGFAADEARATWATGTLATLAGWIVLQIYCPKQEMAHLFTWHGTALVTGTAVAAIWARSRLTR